METNANQQPHPPETRRELNAKADDAVVRAFCFKLPEVTDGKLPEWVPFLPPPDANGRIVGEDGRVFVVKDVRVLASSWRRKLPLDVNHSTDILAPQGKEAPAYGHIVGFEARADSSIWAKVEWNPLGERAMSNREYAFISPAFDARKSDGVIQSLANGGASLVNNPNFTSLALNSQQSTEDNNMSKAIMAALGLPETATEAEAITAINSGKDELQRAINARSTPDLARFVPRADYDAEVLRATNAVKELGDLKDASHKAAVDVEIKGALEAGKITPATEEFYRATCATQRGLEDFKSFVAKTPAVVSDESHASRQVPKTKGKDADPNELAQRALNHQKKQAELGRSLSIAQAMTEVTTQEQ